MQPSLLVLILKTLFDWPKKKQSYPALSPYSCLEMEVLQEIRNTVTNCCLIPFQVERRCIPNRKCVRCWKRTIGNLSDSLRPKARTDSRYPVVRSCLRLFRSQQWPPLAIGTNNIQVSLYSLAYAFRKSHERNTWV